MRKWVAPGREPNDSGREVNAAGKQLHPPGCDVT